MKTKQETDTRLSQIEKEYATILVNQMLNTDDSVSMFNAKARLHFYDLKLKEMGLKATIKVGTEKIE